MRIAIQGWLTKLVSFLRPPQSANTSIRRSDNKVVFGCNGICLMDDDEARPCGESGDENSDEEELDLSEEVEDFLEYISVHFSNATIDEVTWALLAGVSKINCAFGVHRDIVTAQLTLAYEKVKGMMEQEGTFGSMVNPSGGDIQFVDLSNRKN